MRLYLSSLRLGDHPEQLVRLAGAGGRAAVIANAMDGATEAVRRQSVELELREPAGPGFTAEEVDLSRGST
jgi:dipeptidase E